MPDAAGALIFDQDGRLLILKPTYKKGWTIPGGQLEPGQESPWEACRREVREECGLVVEAGRLACVDFRPPNEKRPGELRFLFDCGTLGGPELAKIELQEDEIEDHRLVKLEKAFELLSAPISRRVESSVGRDRCVYLEDGRPLESVG